MPQVLELCSGYPSRSTANAEGNCPAFVSIGGNAFVFGKRSATPPAETVTECGEPVCRRQSAEGNRSCAAQCSMWCCQRRQSTLLCLTSAVCPTSHPSTRSEAIQESM